MNAVEILSGPVIGAAIGYCTNYIAVKMLFRPSYPVKLGNFTLPFTPGVIPKRKEEMARALGSMVGNTLITQEDLEKALLSDGMKQSVINGVYEYLVKRSGATMTIKDTLNYSMDEGDYRNLKLKIQQLLSEKIVAGLSRIDLGAIIADEGGAALKEKVQGTMLAMMFNDKLIESFAEPIGQRVKEYIQNHGAEKIQPVVTEEIENIENQTVSDVLGKIQINEKHIKELAGSLYTDCITGTSHSIIKQIDIVGIVKNKIRDMDVKDMEKLVLSVMKKELNTVVNLGAGLGFIIGLLNLIF